VTTPTPGPQASPGGLAPAPDTNPMGLDLGAPTGPITLPPTTALPLGLPRQTGEVQQAALDRHIPVQWHDVVRQLLPLVVPLARVVLEICEEVHGAQHPTQP
jgi:hypothetical protein